MKKTVICLLLFGIGLTVSAQEKAETVSMRYAVVLSETEGKSDLSYGMEELFYPEFRKMA